MKSLKRLCFLLAALAAVAAVNLGCESTETTESAITVTVEPVGGVLVGKNATATLTASIMIADSNKTESLVLPLEWNISNGGLGAITKSAGLSAVYVSNGKEGANTISVKDRIGRSGVAAVTQTKPAPAPDPNAPTP